MGQLARLVKMGAQAVGEGISSAPEHAAAVALCAALNDPAFLSTAAWAVAWHQNPGEMPEFVAASADGAWLPVGMWLPVGVTLAHADPRVDLPVRQGWEHLPPDRVLAAHARIRGSVPRAVVVRAHSPADAARWPWSTVVVSLAGVPAPYPNPLADSSIGRHRLEVLSPDEWWPVVVALPDEQVAAAVAQVAATVAQAYRGVGGADADRLRAAAVSQIGRAPSQAVADALLDARVEAVMAVFNAAPMEPPDPLPPGWNAGLRRAAGELRAWEALAIASAPGELDRQRLADVVAAAAAAGVVRGDGA